jgi:hypothetical protein
MSQTTSTAGDRGSSEHAGIPLPDPEGEPTAPNPIQVLTDNSPRKIVSIPSLYLWSWTAACKLQKYLTLYHNVLKSRDTLMRGVSKLHLMPNGCVASRLKTLTYDKICCAFTLSRALRSNMICNF